MSPDANIDAEIKALLADLWQRHLPALRERVAMLERVAVLAASGKLAEPERAEAQSIAHKLAGNLGMFGHGDAGLIACDMEQILKEPRKGSLQDLVKLSKQLRQALQAYLE